MKNLLFKATHLYHAASAGIISLNLPTAVQSSRSKGDGRYDAGHDGGDHADEVPAEYVPEPVTEDNASAHVLTVDIIVDDVPTEVPGGLANGCHQQEYQKHQLRISSAMILSVRT